MRRKRHSFIVDVDAAQWKSAVVASGGWVSGPRVQAVSQLIRALKSCGAWYLRDDYAGYAGVDNPTTNQAAALVTLKRRLTQVANNSPTLLATGFQGNTTAFIDTKWNPASGTWQYTQNLAAYGCWVAADPGVAATKRLMGNDDDNFGTVLFGSGGNIAAGINSASSTINVTPANRLGMLEIVRTDSTHSQAFQNTTSLGTSTSAASIAIANRTFYVLSANSSGGASAVINSTVSMAFIGMPLSAGQQSAEWQAWRTFLNLYGVP